MDVGKDVGAGEEDRESAKQSQALQFGHEFITQVTR